MCTTISSDDTIKLDLPANHKYLNVLGACVEQMLTRMNDLVEPDILRYNLQLAVHECCTNIIDHAYEGIDNGRIKVMLALDNAGRRFIATLRDNGNPFDIETTPGPDLDTGQVHGYGLFLMRELLDEVLYESQPGKNIWTLIKYL